MSFSTKVFILLLSLTFSASALTLPHHNSRAVHHRAIAARVAVPVPVDAPTPRKRSVGKRCKARPVSSSVVASSSPSPSLGAVQNVAGSSSPVVQPSTTEVPPTTKPATTHVPTTTHEPTTTQEPTTTKAAPTTKPSTTETTATKTSTAASSEGTSLDLFTGLHSGDGTFYATGLGACGITNVDTDFIAAVSHDLFDVYPGYNGLNPNDNPVCNKKVTANYNGNSVTVTITDRCTGCGPQDLDFSPSAFSQLADQSIGRIHNMLWTWDD